MSEGTDRAYFARRAHQSQVAVDAAPDRSARLAHAQMQAAYELLDVPIPVIAFGGGHAVDGMARVEPGGLAPAGIAGIADGAAE